MSKPGRNELCPCGSGVKYKKCCLGKAMKLPDLPDLPGSIPDRTESQREIMTLDGLLTISQEEIFSFLGYNQKNGKSTIKAFHTLNQHEKGMALAFEPATNDLYFNISIDDAYSFHYLIEPDGRILIMEQDEVPDSIYNGLSFLILKELLTNPDTSWISVTSIRNALMSRLSTTDPSLAPKVFLKEAIFFCPLINSLLEEDPQSNLLKELQRFKLKFDDWDLDTKRIVTSFEEDFQNYIGLGDKGYGIRVPSNFSKLLFRFSDGTELFLAELLFHPYSALLPANTLPCDTTQSKPEHITDEFTLAYHDFRRSFSYDYFPAYASKQACHFLHRLLENLVQKPEKHSLFLVADPSIEASRHGHTYVYEMPPKKLFLGMPITSFKHIPDHAFELIIQPPEIIFQITEPYQIIDSINSKVVPLRNKRVLYLPRYKRLVFSKMSMISSHFKQYPSHFKTKPNVNPLNQFILTPPTTKKKIDPTYARYGLNRILEDAERFFQLTPKIDRNAIPEIQSSSVTLSLYSKKGESQYESIEFFENFIFPGQEHGIRSTHVHKLFPNYIKTLSEGLGASFFDENTKLAVKSNKIKRKNELQLYRHQGLMALFWSVFRDLEKQYSHDLLYQKKTLFIQKMLDLLAPIINQVLKCNRALLDTKSELKDMRTRVSPQFTSNLKNFLGSVHEDFIEKDERHQSWLFPSLDTWYLCNSWLHYKKIMYFISDCMLAVSKTGTMPKERISQMKFPWDGPGILGTDIINQAILHFTGPEYDFLLDDVPLLFENENAFKVEMALSEQDNSLLEGHDWFELNPAVFFNGKKISIKEASQIQKGKPFFYKGAFYLIEKENASPLSWLTFFWERLQCGSSTGARRSSSKIAEIPRSQYLDLLALKALGIDVVGPPRWKNIEASFEKLCRRSEGFDPAEKKLLKALDIPFHPFQETGVLWMRNLYNLGLGGILADDMGLGKTVQTIGLLKSLQQEGLLGNCMIVVPTSLVYNWCMEFEKFAPTLPVSVLDPKNKPDLNQDQPRILLCTYGLTTRHASYLKSVTWNIIAFDEAQSLKNIKSKRTGLARTLKAKSKFCLTGTPMENHYGEYFSLIDLVVPGALGDYSSFMSTYSLKTSTGPQALDVAFLKNKTSPLVLRRMKKEILEQLPEKVESVVHLDLEPEQAIIYRDVATAWNDRVRELIDEKGEANSQLIMLTALLRLRQVCSCPSMVPSVEYDRQPPKLELLQKELQTILSEGESALVFTNFKGTLDYFREILLEQGIPTLCISGSVSAKKRVEILKQFEESDTPQVLLMTLKTGGVGLNLTKASYVFHLEPWWNPQAENQGTDRVHRIGQKKSVNVYRFIMRETIEEKIQKLKKTKEHAFEALFQEAKNTETEKDLTNLENQQTFAHTGLSSKDFKYLLESG